MSISDKRILQVIEHISCESIDMDGKNKLASMVYRFAHLSSDCKNQHEDWREEFLKCERQLIDGGIIGEINEPDNPPKPIKRPSSISI